MIKGKIKGRSATSVIIDDPIEQRGDGLNLATLSKNGRLVVKACRKIAVSAPDYYAAWASREKKFIVYRDPFTEIPSEEYDKLKDDTIDFDILEGGKSVGRDSAGPTSADIVNHAHLHLSGQPLRGLGLIGKVTKIHSLDAYKAECFEGIISCTIGYFDRDGDFIDEVLPSHPIEEAPITMTIDEFRDWVFNGSLAKNDRTT